MRTFHSTARRARPSLLSQRGGLLLVALDLGHRADRGVVPVVSVLAPGLPLPQQVPALVQGLLGCFQLGPLLRARDLAAGHLGPQLVLGLDQLGDAVVDLPVVHVTYRRAPGDTTGMRTPSRFDVVIAGGGHNGLTAAAYLAQAGRSVLVLERQRHVGGAAVSARVFDGVDARLSRFSYLVSLLPASIIADLGLRVTLRRRRIASYTPSGDRGLLVDHGDQAATAASFAALTGSDADWKAWQKFYAGTAALARRVFPTLTEPLRTRAEFRALAGDDAVWEALIEQPLSAVIEREFGHDTVRGLVLTDALIGTFARAGEDSLRQNRCFLYHVIGNGTGDWDVPVGGMGQVTEELARAAREAGAEIRTGAEVTGIDPDGEVSVRDADGEYTVGAGHILANLAPAELARLTGDGVPAANGSAPEGAQLKVNLVLRRLPRLRDTSVTPQAAFA